MNSVESYLFRTRKSLRDACDTLGVDFDTVEIPNIETCSSCSIWVKPASLREDLDGNPICNECFRFYGM